MRIVASILALFGASLGSASPMRASGLASWYGESYRGKPMANGQPFTPDALTCAAWQWPLGTALQVRYRHPRGHWRSVVVTVTDRGPDKRLNRIVDLSSSAFRYLVGSVNPGVVPVEIAVVGGKN